MKISPRFEKDDLINLGFYLAHLNATLPTAYIEKVKEKLGHKEYDSAMRGVENVLTGAAKAIGHNKGAGRTDICAEAPLRITFHQPTAASEHGYEPITNPIDPGQTYYPGNVGGSEIIDSLRRSLRGQDACEVKQNGRIEFWRHSSEINLIEEDAREYDF